MFRKLKNIETAFRYIRWFTLTLIIGCFSLCLFVLAKSYQLAAANQHKIYVLANGKAIEAFTSDRNENILVEARDHIKVFHQYFFTLSPDDHQIQTGIQKALNLADGSANTVYKNLQESNYYAGIIAGNINQTLQIDSIQLDLTRIPYYFQCYGTQTLTRPTNIIVRSLVTAGFLRETARSENNPHGFLIEKWRIIENKDLETHQR